MEKKARFPPKNGNGGRSSSFKTPTSKREKPSYKSLNFLATWMIKVISCFIKIYQKISPFFFPKACRFYPSCSQYAIDALNKYGLGKGIGMIIVRILKCSPASPGGYHPVKWFYGKTTIISFSSFVFSSIFLESHI